ncbi:hypothetical protein [Georgenia daeguensis]
MPEARAVHRVHEQRVCHDCGTSVRTAEDSARTFCSRCRGR